jgi:hypothetical protein
VTDDEKHVIEWNWECPVGTRLHVMVGSGDWVQARQTSRAFVRNGIAVVRVEGFKEPVRLLDVAPVTAENL